ncbi:MAG TPA: hypothetical protein VFQ22_03130 [Longimicrobiales bacterium]|nr:hypothetical protein [Longimicrobiales bacterium]
MRRTGRPLAALLLALAAGARPAVAQDASGTWIVSFESGGEMFGQTLVLRQDTSWLEGTVRPSTEPVPDEVAAGAVPLANGAVIGHAVTFTITLEFGRDVVQYLYSGTFDGDSMHGILRAGDSQPIPFTATRRAPAPPAEPEGGPHGADPGP